jgi:hypothetical protein
MLTGIKSNIITKMDNSYSGDLGNLMKSPKKKIIHCGKVKLARLREEDCGFSFGTAFSRRALFFFGSRSILFKKKGQ